MQKWNPTDADIAEIYAMFWRMVEAVVHRYGSAPTGSMLTVLTISLLDQVNYHPTIGELAKITRLPKSTVSRYVSTEMNRGFLEEIIDPEDRRRRRLHTTERAKEERKWMRQRLFEIVDMSAPVFRNPDKNACSADRLKKLLLGFGQQN